MSETASTLRTVCAWCSYEAADGSKVYTREKVVGEWQPCHIEIEDVTGPLSHGICGSCEFKLIPKLNCDEALINAEWNAVSGYAEDMEAELVYLRAVLHERAANWVGLASDTVAKIMRQAKIMQEVAP